MGIVAPAIAVRTQIANDTSVGNHAGHFGGCLWDAVAERSGLRILIEEIPYEVR